MIGAQLLAQVARIADSVEVFPRQQEVVNPPADVAVAGAGD